MNGMRDYPELKSPTKSSIPVPLKKVSQVIWGHTIHGHIIAVYRIINTTPKEILLDFNKTHHKISISFDARSSG
jgi:hypothetical protein